VAEVKNYPRTNLTNLTANFWEYYGGRAVFEFWNDQASRLIFEHRVQDDTLLASRVYALVNIAVNDAAIACWDAKYTYWAPRPTMIDQRSPHSSQRPTTPATPRRTRVCLVPQRQCWRDSFHPKRACWRRLRTRRVKRASWAESTTGATSIRAKRSGTAWARRSGLAAPDHPLAKSHEKRRRSQRVKTQSGPWEPCEPNHGPPARKERLSAVSQQSASG